MTEYGNMALVEDREEGGSSIRLPGVRSGDMASRAFKPEVRVYCLQFSPTALLMSIRLNEQDLIQEVIENIKPTDVEIIVRSLPEEYMERTLKFVASALETTQHIEFYLIWIQHLLTIHGPKLQEHSKRSQVIPTMLALQKNLTRKNEELSKISDFNKYTLQYLIKLGEIKTTVKTEDDMEIDTLEGKYDFHPFSCHTRIN
ncbi:Periodic tryptophan protein 2 [Blattella germanica]|nr:Periodic tryptophan protein 2 [Blattella germanica]